MQGLAIGLAAAAVLVLAVGLGTPPWTALILASSFAAYGLVKGRVRVGPVVSVFIETLLIAPLALVFLWGAHAGAWTDLNGRQGGFFGHDLGTSLLLVFAGPLTGVPLGALLLCGAADRLCDARAHPVSEPDAPVRDRGRSPSASRSPSGTPSPSR